MSIGIYILAKKLAEDEEFAIYSYAGENWNVHPAQHKDAQLQDGEITLMKRCLEKAEIHSKIQRSRISKKKHIVEKRIPHFPNILPHISSGDVQITRPCKNEFFSNPSDIIGYYAYCILWKLFFEYQQLDQLPDEVIYFQ